MRQAEVCHSGVFVLKRMVLSREKIKNKEGTSMQINNNTLTKSEFFLEHILWAIVTWIWFDNFLFRCINTYSYMESKIIFSLVLGITCVLGILCSIRKNRNEVSVFFNLVMGFGIYTVISYFQIRRHLIILLLSIIIAFSFIISSFILQRQIKRHGISSKTIRIAVYKIAIVSQRITGMGLLVILCIFGGNIIFGPSIIQSSVRPTVTFNSYDSLLVDSIDKIGLLDEKSWTSLTVQEKVGVLQTIANLERSNLGVSNELNVCVVNLEEEGLLGCYDDSTYKIVIDMDLLLKGSAQDVLRCLVHEAFHSFQYRLLDLWKETDSNNKYLWIFRKANIYEEEFEHYNNGEEDFSEYYEQECEITARAYAEKRVEFYENLLNQSAE